MIDITPFLDQFAETKDWHIWSVIADYFADHGDEIGQQWALWVRDERKEPASRSNCSVLNNSKQNYTWACQPDVDRYPLPFLKQSYINSTLFSMGRSLLGEKGILRHESDAYNILLRAFRLLTDAQRAEIVADTAMSH